MRRTRLSTLLATGGTAALLVLTAGCGGSATKADSNKSDTSSSDSSSPSSSSSSDTSASLSKSDIFSKLVDAQKQAGSYTFTMKISAAGQTGTGTGEADTSTDPAAVHLKLTEAGQSFETISAGGIFYLKGSVFGTDKWVKIDPKSDKGLGALVGSASSSDPSSALAAFADAATVTKGGSATIDGVDTTEYDVSVPGSAVAKQSKLGSQMADQFPKEIDYKVFVDGDNLLRRMTNALTVSGQSVSTQIDFADYGKDVSVSAPPASDTTDNFSFGGGTS